MRIYELDGWWHYEVWINGRCAVFGRCRLLIDALHEARIELPVRS